MTTIAYAAITIQTSTHSVPSPPVWFGELTVLAQCLKQQGVLAAIGEQVRFARRRFGRYEVIDFVAVLFGYAITYDVLLSYRTGSMIGCEGAVRTSYPGKSSWRTLYAI